MQPLSLLFPLVFACAALAWGVVKRRRALGYTPLAALLTWWVAYTLVRAVNRWAILAPTRERIGDAPYEGAALGSYYIELALRLSWPFAILAACIVIFLARRAWWTAVAWVVAAVGLCWAYPDLRRRPQSLVEACIASACWVAAVGCAVYGHRKLRVDPPECYVPIAIILGAQLAVIAIVQWGGHQDTEWSIARGIQGAMYSILLTYQAVMVWKPTWLS